MTATGPFKVTQGHRFWYQLNTCSLCEFQLGNNTNLSYFAPFPSYPGVLVKLLLLTGMPLLNTIVRHEPLNFGLQNLASKN